MENKKEKKENSIIRILNNKIKEDNKEKTKENEEEKIHYRTYDELELIKT